MSIFQILSLVVLIASQNVAAEKKADIGSAAPHGGVLISRPQGDFEIVLAPEKNQIDLFWLNIKPKSPKPLPEKVVVLVKPKNGRGVKLTQEIQLLAVDPWRGQPHYQAMLQVAGQPNWGNSSQKGVEFEIRF